MKVIINEYKDGNDNNVVILCDKILYDNKKFYVEIVRGIRYWLCSSLCRLHNERFFQEINYFSGYSDYFLRGFYNRHAKQYLEAEKYYQLALDEKQRDKEYTAKAKHEMVIVKMKLGKYGDALKLAEDNYNHQKANTYHIESYFRCLVRSRKPNKYILKHLIEELKDSYDVKKDIIVSTLEAEYKFFIDGDFPEAVKDLRELIDSNPKYRYYPFKTLDEICKKRDAIEMTHDLREMYRKDIDEEPDEAV